MSTASHLRPYERVRVRQLRRDANDYDGWRVNQRPPKVGDVGCLIDFLHAAGLPDRFVVECVNADGTTEWLGEFEEDELEPVGPS